MGAIGIWCEVESPVGPLRLTGNDEALTGGEQQRAISVARAALHKYANAPNRAAFQRRLGGYLQRRGFGFDTISPILATLWNEVHGAEDDDGDERLEIED